MKLKTQVFVVGMGYCWRVEHQNWRAVNWCEYTTHWSAVRGLARFLQRVMAI